MQRHILAPLGMTETAFSVPEAKWPRLLPTFARQADGGLVEWRFAEPRPPAFESGGGGLLGTAQDYTKFVQMILSGGGQVLKRATVEEMACNQVGRIKAGLLKTTMPQYSLDADFHPGHDDRWGLGFLLNETAYEGGRSAGSLAWAGLANTFFWIDRTKGVAGILLMQMLPFFDPKCIAALREFERAVYS
jgi:CubicO group peptidase (beta-lactamase class C family)